MSESIFSQTWYRIADARPKLKTHVRVHHHTYRERHWYVIEDLSTGRYHRISAEAYGVVGLMNGLRTMDEIWAAAHPRLGDEMLTQDEILDLVVQLHKTEVLQLDLVIDADELAERQEEDEKNKWLVYLQSPLSVKFPLVDPDAFLEATLPFVRWMFSPVGLAVWLAVVVGGLALGFLHHKELMGDIVDRALSVENLVILGCVYPLVKLLHELGHAYATKHLGGEVHELGLMFLVFVPVPYVDTSSASAFAERGERMLVGLAGILVELFLAGLALMVWVHISPGTARAICYNVILIGSVSTVLLNGNPLMRYDGYFVASDWLEIPNLGPRSSRYLSYVSRRYLLGIHDQASPAGNTSEAVWMGVYGVLSFFYRVLLTVRILLYIASQFLVLGGVLLVWSAYSMFLVPTYQTIKAGLNDHAMKSKRLRVMVLGGGACVALAYGAFFVKMPMFTVTEGVLWAPENTRVTAGSGGFVKEVLVGLGERVRKGQPLVVCHDPELDSKVHVLEAQLKEMEAKFQSKDFFDRVEAEIVKDEMARVQGELKRANERKADLTVLSPNDGVYMAQDLQDQPGRFVNRGALLGYVLDPREVLVRAVIPQGEVDAVRNDRVAVQARLASARSSVISARVVQDVPAASKELPSMALSTDGGGGVAVDPKSREHPEALRALFQIAVKLDRLPPARIGERVYVRVQHASRTPAEWLYRTIRRLVLDRVGV